MRILFDIVHPADVLFFLNPIRIVLGRGDECLILSRHKDVVCDLLDGFGLPHIPITVAGHGVAGLAQELVRRNLTIFRYANRFRPNAMVGFGGVAISHVGCLTRIPSIAFYDADTAILQTRIAWPFIHHLYVPEAYAGSVPANRTTRFHGIKELSYFATFRPDPEIAQRNGGDPNQDNFLLRIVSWRAGHDIGKTGWPEEKLSQVVSYLAEHGRVHISSERPLPHHLETHRYVGRASEIHHLLGCCRLYVGESVTMAQEAFALGVAAIYDGHDCPGTTNDLMRRGLIGGQRNSSLSELVAMIDHQLSGPREAAIARRNTYMKECPDLARYVVAAIDRHARNR